MTVDLASILLGVVAGALPCLGWIIQLQRRQGARQGEQALLEERLNAAQLAQAGLQAQLDASRDEISDLSEANTLKQSQLAAQGRELELLQIDRDNARDAAHAWHLERANREAELRRLEAQSARLEAELREQQESHQQRLEDLQEAVTPCVPSSPKWPPRSSTSVSSALPRPASSTLAGCSTPSRNASSRSKNGSRRATNRKPGSASRWAGAGAPATAQPAPVRRSYHLTQALKGQKTQGNWGELILERVLEHAGLEKGREYQTQVSLKSADGERFQPDVLIMLPGDKQVVVDAKVSLTAYQQFVSSNDEAALKQHVQSLRSHVKGLSSKDYNRLEGLHSLDFVLLFVPIEAAFSAPCRRSRTCSRKLSTGRS